MLTAPYLVSMITGLAFIRYLPKSTVQGTLPFVMAAAAVIYGVLVGAVNHSLVVVLRTTLAWLPPILFGFYLSTLWQHYPVIRKLILRIFLWGTVVLGLYGIWQYLVAPDWDRYWLRNVAMVSFGKPEPRQIRVWSTLNSPVSFGSVMIASLMLLFSVQSNPMKIPAAAAGYLSFLLCSVRAVCGGWIVAIVTLITSLKQTLQIRLIVTLLIMATLVVPLSTVQPFAKVIGDRFGSLSSIANDSSFRDRRETYSQNLDLAFSQWIGKGLGATNYVNEEGQVVRVAFDSGVLDVLFTLGWMGTIPYLLGIILLLFRLLKGQESRSDSFANACRSIVVSHLLMLGFGSFMIDSPGFILWTFMGLGLSANKYFSANLPSSLVNNSVHPHDS